jgi:integral membrane protein (TIGR04561 family)
MGIKKVIGMNLFDADVFKVLNWNVPLFIFLIIFIVVALICLGLFIFFVAKKTKRHDIEHGTVDVKELKRLETFEDKRNDFETEIAKIKRVIRQQK